MKTQLKIGDQVEVSEPCTHKFLGIIIGIIIGVNNSYIQVRDMDDNVFKVSPWNCKLYEN